MKFAHTAVSVDKFGQTCAHQSAAAGTLLSGLKGESDYEKSQSSMGSSARKRICFPENRWSIWNFVAE